MWRCVVWAIWAAFQETLSCDVVVFYARADEQLQLFFKQENLSLGFREVAKYIFIYTGWRVGLG